MKHLIITGIIAMLISGCGDLADDDKQSADTQTNSALQPNVQNSTVRENINAIGSIGENTKFGDNEKITEGVWSLYVNRNEQSDLDYDIYLSGYKFFIDGTLESREDALTPLFRQKRQNWGVNSAGSTITMTAGYKYTYTGQFDNERSCYVITGLGSGETGKLCHETDNNQGKETNSLGHFGDDVTYGTYKRLNIVVEGSWEFYEISKSVVATEAKYKRILKSDGFVDGEEKLMWGVSEDGKVLLVGDDSYLIYKYLENNCFRTIHYTNNSFKNEFQICKI